MINDSYISNRNVLCIFHQIQIHLRMDLILYKDILAVLHIFENCIYK